MKRFLLILPLLLFAIPALAQTGWLKQPATTTFQGNGQDLCPPNNFGGFGYAYDTNCPGVFEDWTTAPYDENSIDGPRLLIFGGGHAGYLGNEIYAWDIHKGKSFRLTNPQQPPSGCSSTMPDGTPNIAVHDYGGPFVNIWQNRMYVWARLGAQGSNINNACAFFDMWSLDLTSINESCAPSCTPSWRHETPTGLPTTEVLLASYSDFNQNDGLGYVFEPFPNGGTCNLSKFSNSTWTLFGNLATSNCTNFANMVIDQSAQVAIVIGGSTDSPNPTNYWVDISPGATFVAHHPSIDASCSTISAVSNPALTYDVRRQEVVAFSGVGGIVYIVTVNKAANTITCVAESYGSTVGVDIPESSNVTNGGNAEIFNKFHYDAADDSYALWDNPDKTSWILKRPPVVRITNTSVSTITNTPVSDMQSFAQGDIPNFPQAKINGSTVMTQADVKTRWPDGSVQQAIVSYVVPSITASVIQKVYFVNQASGNNTGFLAKADMLGAGYNFDMQIQETGTASHTISARAILNACSAVTDPGTDPSSGLNGNCRYWLKGPVVTAVILEDRSASRSLDFNSDSGSGNPLHPYFECWFWPQNNNVDCVASVENVWASSTIANSTRDQTYSFVLTGGNTSPTTLFTQASFLHIARSRWVKDYCINGTGSGTAMLGCMPIDIDHNMPYEAYSKVLPNFDPEIIIAQSELTSYSNGWATGNQSIPGPTPGQVGQIGPDLDTGGTSPWWGRINTWDIMYLFSHSGACPAATCGVPAQKQSLGNAQVGGRLPFHYRESDSTASAASIFYDASGTVNPVGRTFSVNARPQESIGIGPGNDGNPGNGFNDPCGGSNVRVYSFGTMTTDTWNTDGMDPSHWPEIGLVPYLSTGKFYYLEETQLSGAYMVGWGGGCPGGRRDGSQGILFQSQFRGEAWSIRSALDAYIVSPDGSPEKAYFLDKLSNTAIAFEGTQAITNTDSTRVTAYNFGVSNMDPNGVSPLHFYAPGFSTSDMTAFVESPLDTTAGHILGAFSPWEEHYNFVVYASARDIGIAPFDSLLSWASNRAFHAAADPNVGNFPPFMVGTYRYPTKLSSTNNWLTTYTQYQQAFTQGNGSGIANAWVPAGCVTGSETACASQKPCNYSPEDDHWHASPLAELALLYPYNADGFSGHLLYDSTRVSLYGSGGCMPAMFNNPTTYSLANPKWDIVPRRATVVQAPSSPTVSLSPTTVPFASQTVGTTSAAQTVTLTNASSATLTISSITLTGTNPTNFGISNNTCGSTLGAGLNCTLQVSFSPLAVQSYSANLTFTTNAATSPDHVALSGSGVSAPAVLLSPTSISFPNQAINSTSFPAQSITLTNTGAATLNITSITLSGSNPSNFSIVNNTCGSTLGAGLNCTLQVNFSPVLIQSYSATLVFSTNAAGSPNNLALTGTGVQQSTVTGVGKVSGSASVNINP